jgi:small subunit ribosomal protein S16
MLRIRLRRVGAKKQPSYRIVVAEKSAPRDGKFVEVIGFYKPRTEPETVRIEEERALHWLSVGAQPSDSVARIFTTHGTMDRFERLRGGEALETLVEEAAQGDVEADEEPEEDVEAEEAETASDEDVEEVVEEEAPAEDASEEDASEEDASDEGADDEEEPEEGEETA